MAMSLVQGGSGYPFIAPPVYDYLCDIDLLKIEITVEDIPIAEIRRFVQKVSVC